MNPSRRVAIRALRAIAVGVLAAAASASAQSIDDARRALDWWPDPIARSPRLLGMGRLSLVVDDPHNRITLWDFALNPAGIMDSDTSSALEIGPSTAAISSIHDLTSGLRQDLAAREVRIAYEGWHRSPDAPSYGAIGDFGSLRLDRPWSAGVEKRTHYNEPSVMPVLTGPMPYVLSDRMRYVLRLIESQESSEDHYRAIVGNSVGQYIDRDGQIGPPPDFFTPDEYTIHRGGGGVGLSYRLGAPLTASLGWDRIGTRVAASNSGGRYESEVTEERGFMKNPLQVGQATLIGRVGRDIEWGADARGWKASADQRWVFSVSAGIGGIPLEGRGLLSRRKEEGTALRTRVRWTRGPLELGAGLNTSYRRIEIIAPDPSDPTSFNHFLNVAFYRNGADSLVYPDSVVSNAWSERGWEVGGGLAWHLPGKRTVVGFEFHQNHDLLLQELSGPGPKREGWDARTGVEYGVNRVLALRGGFIYRREDRDTFTRQNEYVSETVTVGAGLTPAGAQWALESGYGWGWTEADFGDPGRPRASSQQLSVRCLWRF